MSGSGPDHVHLEFGRDDLPMITKIRIRVHAVPLEAAFWLELAVRRDSNLINLLLLLRGGGGQPHDFDSSIYPFNQLLLHEL